MEQVLTQSHADLEPVPANAADHTVVAAPESSFPPATGSAAPVERVATRSFFVETPEGTNPVDAPGEFDYKPIPVLAPATLFFGLLGPAALVAWFGVVLSLLGVCVGLLALWQIRRSEGELGGRKLALAGTLLAGFFSVAGGGWHTYDYATEVPEGYERVSFSWLAKQGLPAVADGNLSFPPDVAALNDKPIFIKGYMYPTRQTQNLSEFVLVKDTGDCCFGGQPKLTDMIVVRYPNGVDSSGRPINFRNQQLVSVAGVFHAKSAARSGELTAVYSLDGTHFK